MRSVIVTISIVLAPIFCNAQSKEITLYSTASPGSLNIGSLNSNSGYSVPGYAIISEIKELDLTVGTNEVKSYDVPNLVDPTTITFKSLTDQSGTNLVEQSFNFDLVNDYNLAQSSIGESVSVQSEKDAKMIVGTLIGFENNSLIIKDANQQVINIKNPILISYNVGDKNLLYKPELLWNIKSEVKAKHKILTSYQTKGMTWWVNYNANYNENKNSSRGTLDLSAWVTLVNKSGADHNNSKLKLIAGDVNKVNNSYEMSPRGANKYSAVMMSDSSGFKQDQVFDYQMYSLDRPVDLPNNSIKQVMFFDAVNDIQAKKHYIYHAAKQQYYGNLYVDKGLDETSDEIEVWLSFKNSKEEGLGMPLPSGLIRVNQINTAVNSAQFIGEDTIGRKSKDEKISINMGKAFDIKGKRKQLSYTYDQKRRFIEEVIEITINNHKDKEVEVEVVESMFRSKDWKIIGNSHEYTKDSASIIKFQATIQPEDVSVIKYKVQYSW